MSEVKNEPKKELKKEVAEKFELEKGTAIVSYFPGFGEIDLSQLTVSAAENLIERGFTWLKPKSKTQAATKVG